MAMELSDDRTARTDAPPPRRPPMPRPAMPRVVGEELRLVTAYANAQLRAAEVCNHIADGLRALADPHLCDPGAGMAHMAQHSTLQALAALRRAEALVDLPTPDLEAAAR